MLKTKTPIQMPEFAPFLKLDAGTNTLSQTAQIRSEARLEQIFLQARQQSPTISLPRKRATSKKLALRIAAIPVAAAAIISTMFLLPHDAGVVAPAFANWTPIPIVMADIPAESLASYHRACRDFIQESIFDNPWYEDLVAPTTVPAEPVLAETRGDFTWLLYSDPGDKSLSCVIQTAPIPATKTQVVLANIYAADFGRFQAALSVAGPQYEITGTSNSSFGITEIGSQEAVINRVTSLNLWPYGMVIRYADGRLTQESAQAMLDLWNSGERVRLRLLEGLIGTDVAAVVLNTRAGESITATVIDGRFAAWHPSVDSPTSGTDHVIESLTVTLHDGTTFEQPIQPGRGMQ